MTSIQEAKKTLRREMKSRLASYSETFDKSTRPEVAASLLDTLSDVPGFEAARAVAAFIDFQNEVPLKFAFTLLYSPDRQTVAVPRCVGNDMLFYKIDKPDSFVPTTGEPLFPTLLRNAYGILEPDPASPTARLVAPQEFDVVLIPGLAFDKSGRRLGRGKGYYDRFLAQTKPTAVLVALAFDCQIIDEDVPTDENDRLVHYIATPTQLVKTQSV